MGLFTLFLLEGVYAKQRITILSSNYESLFVFPVYHLLSSFMVIPCEIKSQVTIFSNFELIVLVFELCGNYINCQNCFKFIRHEVKWSNFNPFAFISKPRIIIMLSATSLISTVALALGLSILTKGVVRRQVIREPSTLHSDQTIAHYPVHVHIILIVLII